MKKKRLKKYLKRLLKANLNLQQSLNLKKNDRDFWKCKADEYAQLHNKTLAERDEWKDAANKNFKLYENLINARYEERKANKKFVEDAVNVLDLCFIVMMQPYELKYSVQSCGPEATELHRLGINTNASEWIEARKTAEKLYYELKKRLVEESGDQYHKTGGLEIWGEDFKNQLSKLYEKYYPAGEENIRNQEFHVSEDAKSFLAPKMPTWDEIQNDNPDKRKPEIKMDFAHTERIVPTMQERKNNLLKAICDLGYVENNGYCFCSADRRGCKVEHDPKCAELLRLIEFEESYQNMSDIVNKGYFK